MASGSASAVASAASGALARHERDRGPGAATGERAVGDRGKDARAADRRLSGTGLAGHENEGLRAQAIEDDANLRCSAEEQRPVIGLERAKATVWVAFGDRGSVGLSRELFERLAKIVAGSEAVRCGAGEAAIDDRREPRIDARRDAGEPGRVPVLCGTGQIRERHVMKRRVTGRELEQHGTEAVDVRTPACGLSAPDLRRHVVGRSCDRTAAACAQALDVDLGVGLLGLRRAGGVLVALHPEQSREPEVEELGVAFVADEDVR